MNIILRAKNGMWLTDGESYAKTIDLAEGADIGRYTEITQAEYDAIIAKQAAEAEL